MRRGPLHALAHLLGLDFFFLRARLSQVALLIQELPYGDPAGIRTLVDGSVSDWRSPEQKALRAEADRLIEETTQALLRLAGTVALLGLAAAVWQL